MQFLTHLQLLHAPELVPQMRQFSLGSGLMCIANAFSMASCKSNKSLQLQ
jgi:hypothetical protein